MSKPLIILSSCADADTAQKIASELVERHLAACVSVVDRVRSTYRWEGKINVANEALLIIKSMSQHQGPVQEVVKRVSGYDVPEILAINIADGSEQYLNWLRAECGG